MACCDFGDAFPSLFADWPIACLVFADFEGGFLRTLLSLYWMPTAFIQQAAGLRSHFLRILCGPRMGAHLRAHFGP